MRLRSTLLAAVLVGSWGLAGCGGQPAAEPSAAGSEHMQEGAATIPDDFPLAAGMGGPHDEIPTSRTGTGLRDLELCGTSPLRGLGTRDRMVADNSGGESADTRELVLVGHPDEAVQVARTFAGLVEGCDDPDVTGDMETTTELRGSPFGAAPAATLVQTYTFDGEPGEGHTILHVVPVGAALLVSSTYGQNPDERLERDIVRTVASLRETVTAMEMFADGTPTPSTTPGSSVSSSVSGVTRVGAARAVLQTYGEGSLASLDEQADGVTGPTGTIVPALCVFTKTGC